MAMEGTTRIMRRVWHLLVLFLAVNKGMAGAAGTTNLTSCAFPFERFREKVEEVECADSLGGGEMVQCLTFLLQQANRPARRCCAAAARTWRRRPECLCKLAFYLPGSDLFSAVTGPEMLRYCNLTADLCHQCPPLLGLSPDSLEKEQPIALEKLLVPVAMGCFAVLVVVAPVILFIVWRRRELHLRRMPDREEVLRIEGTLGKPILFAFKVLKGATNGFSVNNKLGQGGFGVVYKGVLQDGSEVAVKKLSAVSRQGEEEFLNEVMLITRVQHRNLVKLRGCCIKGKERLLVYEYLENKSLHEALLDGRNRVHLDWQARMKILIGIARGLAYLHDGCQTRIVHRDIKSSNILLDRELHPKIADFGLARLFSDDQSHVSTRVAGTIGYLSPEYAMRGQLSEKVDVFSFGIVALELVSGRGNFNIQLPTDQAYLLDWAWTLHENGSVLNILDPRVVDAADSEQATRVIEMALLCTQSVASMRPSMAEVACALVGQPQVEARNSLVKPSFHVFSSVTSMDYPFRSLTTSRNDATAITVVTPR